MAVMTPEQQAAIILLATVVVGVILLSAAAWCVGVVVGLGVTGTLILIAGHWLAFLLTRGGKR